MSAINKYKRPFFYFVLLLLVLTLVIAIGYPLGFLSKNPDGLEKVLIDYHGEAWFDNLFSSWIPLLSWIDNEYVAGILGVFFSAVIMISTFYLIINLKKRKKN